MGTTKPWRTDGESAGDVLRAGGRRMNRRSRVRALLLIALAVGAAKLGQQLFRWYAYADEREQLQELRSEVEEAGLEVARTQLQADSLRDAIERMDGELARARNAVGAFGRHSVAGALPPHLYEAYRDELDRYNRGVTERNGRFAAWQEVVTRNHAAVGRYNRLADSIRALAERMGEPYYSIPSPAELALEHGLVAP